MALTKGLSPLHLVAAILVVKLSSVFLVQTWFVPDEYWQTLEVAHKQVFGYGNLTWEWKEGIRSYLYPALVSGLYTVLKYTGLDFAEALIILPRILQALFSAYGDYCFYQWTGGRKWALYLLLTAWFWYYNCSRTLLQTVETTLVMIALSKYPFRDGKHSYYFLEKESTAWLWIAVVSVFIRPTSAPLWAVFGIYSLLTTNEGRLRLLVRTYVPIVLITGSALIGLDSYFYGRWIVTPWEFFRFNVLHDIGSFYGQHPWYWYLTHGLPAVLGVNVLPLIPAVVTVLRRPREHTVSAVLLAAVGVHLAVHSYVPHKEFRFLLPVLPLLLYLQQEFVVRWSRKAKEWQLYAFALVILVGNLAASGYLGLVHQSGSLRLMPLLRDAAAARNDTQLLFLTPCHSTPLYSHLHMNISAQYLTCSPPIDGASSVTEAEAFFNNPLRWWRGEYLNKATPHLLVMFDKLKGRMENALQGYKLLHEVFHTHFRLNRAIAGIKRWRNEYLNKATPHLLVMFDKLKGRMENALQGYKLLHKVFHTHYPEGEVGENILVFQKIVSRPKPADDAV